VLGADELHFTLLFLPHGPESGQHTPSLIFAPPVAAYASSVPSTPILVRFTTT
jgi:hypothetical protein